MNRRLFVLLASWAAFVPARAEVAVPPLFGDHMVFPANMAAPVWGTAAPGEKIEVAIDGASARTEADGSGKWKVKIGPLPPSAEPTRLAVTGTNKLLFTDVLVGDVWLCAGQSNMEFKMNRTPNSPETLAKANFPLLRLFEVKKAASFVPLDTLEGQWMVCTPATAKMFSAVAYFFGHDLQQAREGGKLPVGLLSASWGGATGEGWMSLAALDANPDLAPYAAAFRKITGTLPELREKYRTETFPAWQKEHDAWQQKRDAATPEEAKALGSKEPKQPPPPDQDQRMPTVLHNGMLGPLIPFGIKGTVWYQGEQNASDDASVKLYGKLLPALVGEWRRLWGEGNFPFIVVQLPGFGPHKSWAPMRDVQLRALSLPATALVVTIDLGDEKDVHPRMKEPVGHRASLAARKMAYGEPIVGSGPIYASMTVEGNKARLAFTEVGTGLVPGGNAPLAPDGSLVGFVVAGADRRFVPARAEIAPDNTVVVSSPEVAIPVAVRYAWDAFPPVSLFNKEGLPASPFATDSGAD